ncbi:BTAD domain-containing putative transcriptional regulator [Pseudofrankia inefficax]|uniref:Transcriptional regulator, SARP family n=1 Tax=Pseudofrankia inefficax (strain DSM 45817 / CECT 9037 / DDB 130130 / EuI1c) TaxID=298654 RepID=E3IW86_PSEI1|nr:BTAD domain-containing putative transcriptional regulator [Pseudofrankia inefficax]ADP78928.1 transcriptional regulator, SARP family [Pseudofrankia inefficax]
MQELGIELFGRFRVAVGDRVVPDSSWSRRKPAALVKLLALAPGHRLRREKVMDQLWPDLDAAAAAANLRKALLEARRALAGEGADGADLIVSIGDLLALPADHLRVDVDDYWTAAAAARRAQDADAYVQAMELHRDGLLPEDVYEEWADGPRDELLADWTALAAELAGLMEARGELAKAAHAVARLVAADPSHEDNQAWLMRLYALAGRREDARRQYDRLRESLAAELGTEPSARTQRLYEEIRMDQVSAPELPVALWERVGDLRAQSGDADATAKAYEQALMASADTATAGRLHRKIATALLMLHLPDSAEPHLDAADRLGPDAAEQGRLVCLRANISWERGDLETARRLATRAHELAVTHGERDDVTDALEALAIISHIEGTWRSGLQDQIHRIASDDLGDRVSRFYEINHCIGQNQLYSDKFAGDVDDYARQTLVLAERADAVGAQAFAWCLLGESLLLRGHWDEAAACLERSCELYAPMGSRSVALPWLRLAELAVCTGELDQVAPRLKRAAAIAAVTPLSRHAWARLHATAALAALERGDPDGALRAVRAAQRTAERYGECATCGALLNPIGAETFARIGDSAGAAAFAAAAARTAASFESTAFRAMAASADGSAATADGDQTLAQARFEAAAALYEKAEQPFWAARSRRLAAGLA